jgi:hypothetical protein
MSKTAWIILGLVGAAVILGAGKAVTRPGAGKPGKPPAPVKAGEKLTILTYQQILQKRTGMRYAQAKQTPAGLEFTSPVNGFVTRNVTKDGLVEIQPA